MAGFELAIQQAVVALAERLKSWEIHKQNSLAKLIIKRVERQAFRRSLLIVPAGARLGNTRN